MKLKNTSVCLLAGWMLMACSGGGYEKTSNGIIVSRTTATDGCAKGEG